MTIGVRIINDIGLRMNWNSVCLWGVTVIALIKGLLMVL